MVHRIGDGYHHCNLNPFAVDYVAFQLVSFVHWMFQPWKRVAKFRSEAVISEGLSIAGSWLCRLDSSAADIVEK